MLQKAITNDIMVADNGNIDCGQHTCTTKRNYEPFRRMYVQLYMEYGLDSFFANYKEILQQLWLLYCAIFVRFLFS